MISFEITGELKEKIRKEAFLHRKTISAEIRFILEHYFENKDEQRFKR